MIVNKASLNGVFETFKAIFDDYLKTPVAFDVTPFVMDVPATAASVNYNWLSGTPAMRKWLGDKVRKDVSAHAYTVTSDEYEATLSVKRRDVETDQLGLYKPAIQSLADEARQHKIRLFAELIEANPLCADGQNLIDSDHPLDDGTTYSNTSSTALSLTSLKAARLAHRSLVDAEGRPLAIMPNVLMVPVDLEDTAIQICYSAALPGSANNDVNPVRSWGLDVVVNPFLTDANNWYLIDTTKAVKPVIYQHRVEPHIVEQTGPDADGVFNRGEFAYSVEADYTMVAGLPQVIYGAIVT